MMNKKKYLLIGLISGMAGIGIGAFAMVYSSNALDTTDNAMNLSWEEPENEYPTGIIQMELYPDLIIQPSTKEWTSQSVPLTITATGVGIEKIRLPDGNVVSEPTATYTATENGPYTFYGLTKDEKVLVVSSVVVANIDQKGKEVLLIPEDGAWRNTDVEVFINPQE